MIKPNNELGFALSDLYPNWGGIDTSQLATLEDDDLEAMNENADTAEASKTTTASKKNIMLAMLVMVALVVFFGGK